MLTTTTARAPWGMARALGFAWPALKSYLISKGMVPNDAKEQFYSPTLDVIHLWHRAHPPYLGKKSKQAKDLRAQFVKKRKEMPDKLNITPVVRLATRVRVEMMHSISAMVKRVDPTVDRAMCLQYAPKPVIKIFRKTAAGADVTKTMSFTESITWVKVNGLEDRINLAKAYERAGASSRGTLAQSFVLLK